MLIAAATSLAEPVVSEIACAVPSAPVIVMPAAGLLTTLPLPSAAIELICGAAVWMTLKVVEPGVALPSLVATTLPTDDVAAVAVQAVGSVRACAAVCIALSLVLIAW